MLKLNCAITNNALRQLWWLVNGRQKIINSEGVLKYAIDDNIGLCVDSKLKIKQIIKLELRSTNWEICFNSDIKGETFKILLKHQGFNLDRIFISGLESLTFKTFRTISYQIKPYLATLREIVIRFPDVWHIHSPSKNYPNSIRNQTLLQNIQYRCKSLQKLNLVLK